MASGPEPSIQLLAEAAENESRVPIDLKIAVIDQDDRSSSLSDIEDRHVIENNTEEATNKSPAPSDDDTEAETERLEATPHKLGKQKVLVNNAEVNSQDPTAEKEPSPTSSMPEKAGAIEAEYASDGLDPSSEMSSLEDLGEEGSGSKSPTSTSSRKRKRGEDDTAPLLKKAAMELEAHMAEHSDPIERDAKADDAGYDHHEAIETADVSEDEAEESQSEEHRKEDTSHMEIEPEAESPQSVEDEDMEDAGVEADAGSAARSEEEMAKKKLALDSLSAIEKDFALLRDRLFSERARQLNEELATLEGPNITHPDYLNMVKAIGQQKLQRIQLAKINFDYKLGALQTKCISERCSIHSQYEQTVRETRDDALSRANAECYQIQHERRKMDKDNVGRMYHLSTNRADLVAQANAYNREVSILSGVAKYVGFPAAPEIEAANLDEREEDLRKMGIPPQSIAALNPPAQLRRLPRPAGDDPFHDRPTFPTPRQPVAAEISNGVMRQAPPAAHRLPSPSTPWLQRRPADAPPMVNGSGSTIPVHPSSSISMTPMSVDMSSANSLRAQPASVAPAETPSRPPGAATEPPRPPASSVLENDAGTEAPRKGADLTDAVMSDPVPNHEPVPISGPEKVPKDVKSSPSHVDRARDPLIGPPSDRMHGGFGQPPGLAAGVKVGNA